MRETCPECGVDELEVHASGCSRDPHAKYRRPILSTDSAIPVVTITPPPINLTFSDKTGQIGEFLWDEDKRIWTFTGDADESAKIFIDFVIKQFGERLNASSE